MNGRKGGRADGRRAGGTEKMRKSGGREGLREERRARFAASWPERRAREGVGEGRRGGRGRLCACMRAPVGRRVGMGGCRGGGIGNVPNIAMLSAMVSRKSHPFPLLKTTIFYFNNCQFLITIFCGRATLSTFTAERGRKRNAPRTPPTLSPVRGSASSRARGPATCLLPAPRAAPPRE